MNTILASSGVCTEPDQFDLARAHGLDPVFCTRTRSLLTANRDAGIEWTRLAIQRGADSRV